MTRVSLPDDQWAELADPRKVSERKRRPYVQAMVAFTQATALLPVIEEGEHKGDHPPGSFGPEHTALFDATLDLLVVALVKAWSFDLPIDANSLQDLPVDCFDVLRKAVNEKGPALMPDLSVDPDPKAPSGELPQPPTALSTDGLTSVTP